MAAIALKKWLLDTYRTYTSVREPRAVSMTSPISVYTGRIDGLAGEHKEMMTTVVLMPEHVARLSLSLSLTCEILFFVNASPVIAHQLLVVKMIIELHWSYRAISSMRSCDLLVSCQMMLCIC